MTGHNRVSLGAVCPSCGRLNEPGYEDSNFCEHCGAALPEPAQGSSWGYSTPLSQQPGRAGEGIELRPTGAVTARPAPPRRRGSLIAPALLALALAGLVGFLVYALLAGGI